MGNQVRLPSILILKLLRHLSPKVYSAKDTIRLCKSYYIKIHWASLVAQWLRVLCQWRRRGFYPWSRTIPHAVEQLSPVPQLLSLRSRAREPWIPSSCATTTEAQCPGACSATREPPAARPHTATRVVPSSSQREKSPLSNKDPLQ